MNTVGINPEYNPESTMSLIRDWNELSAWLKREEGLPWYAFSASLVSLIKQEMNAIETILTCRGIKVD